MIQFGLEWWWGLGAKGVRWGKNMRWMGWVRKGGHGKEWMAGRDRAGWEQCVVGWDGRLGWREGGVRRYLG